MTSSKQPDSSGIVVLQASHPVESPAQSAKPNPMTDESTNTHAELARLKELVGSDELSYIALKLELWAVRDLLIGMEAELGNARGRCQMLERDIEVSKRELRKAQERNEEHSLSKSTDFILNKARSLRNRQQ